MKVGILPVGKIAPEVLVELGRGIEKIYPDTSCLAVKDPLSLPKQAFDKKRNQYNSSVILSDLRFFAANERFHRVLGLVNVDVFLSGLNYVFGEADVLGRVGLVSLWRLKPGFYQENAAPAVFKSRTLKEAVHEIGHTLGVVHCPKSFCAMHFSNSIFDTDKKQSLLCDQCYLQASLAISNLG